MPEFTTDFRLYREALFADDAAIVLWDPEANEAALDNAGSSVFGPTLETALKDKAFASFYFIREDDRDRVRTAATDLMAKVTGAEDRSQSFRYSTECHFVDGDGVQTWCELQILIHKADDGRLYTLTVFHNDERDHRREEELRPAAKAGIRRALVEKARAYIAEHACDGIRVADVVLHLGVSRSLLDLRFRQVCGKSVLEDILDVRFAEVRRQLSRTGHTILQIGRDCGFNDPDHLKRMFKMRYGMSMRQFRVRPS